MKCPRFLTLVVLGLALACMVTAAWAVWDQPLWHGLLLRWQASGRCGSASAWPTQQANHRVPAPEVAHADQASHSQADGFLEVDSDAQHGHGL